ncbi:MAG: hypothetical protein COU35_01625 [Candidatus Magasanikbacteria bacterium CG10_big_fil_rev_8_21_14_0_10_47_10]|uniref:PDZ domain-containing protein n=1 Tax=Candidatus Magasanikbacteria bacterium CG10_big_fil_rev_8_21_14_0_10_47_10 TaxID=1974652 RepID=A0A2H0TQY4_9BACT|nr:MAG: hypothetical protein COU35_01625 [Candidatus Magasanikbacteria bacterium CG10_big_fil_rev_8_21_14_0_10_47_10]
MKQAPHLPKKDFDIDSPRVIFLFVMIAFLAFSSAIAGTLATVAWITPSGGSTVRTNTFLRQASPASTEISPLDLLIEQQVRQRSVGIYNADKQTPEGVFLPDSFIAPAAVLNAEGWSVAYIPEYRIGAGKKWLVVTAQGDIVKVQQAIHDTLNDLVYFKIVGDGFRGDISFFDWKDDPSGQFYAFDIQHFAGVSVSTRHLKDSVQTLPIWEPQSFLKVIGDEIHSGDLLLNSSGVLVGIVSEDGTIVESWQINLQVPSLFENKIVSYFAVPVSGSSVEAYQQGDRVIHAPAFFVTHAVGKASASTLAVGDIITHVDDQPFDSEFTAKYLLEATDPVKFGILRKGESTTVVVAQQYVSL